MASADIETTCTDLAACLGDFWSQEYGGRDQVRLFIEGLAAIYANDRAAREDWAALLSLATVKPLATVPYLAWTLRPGANDAAVPARTFGDGTTFGSGAYFGEMTSAGPAYPKPAGLVRAAMLVDAPRRPTIALVDGCDFAIEADRIRFNVDPFDDPRIQALALEDGSVPMFFAGARVDDRRLDLHYGYVMGCDRRSTDTYRRFLMALWHCVAIGASDDALDEALAAIADAPRAEGDETVQEVVHQDGRPWLVITERRCYRVPAIDPIVMVGDVLEPGQILGDAIRRSRMGKGVPDGVRFLALGPADTGLDGATAWADEDVATTIAADRRGHTTIEWPLDGNGAAYWQTVDRVALARALDSRGPSAATEPSSVNLPTRINPLDFLCREMLPGADCVRFRVDSFGPDSPGLDLLGRLKACLPPEYRMMVVATLPRLADAATLGEGAAGRVMPMPERLVTSALGGDVAPARPRGR